MAGALPPKIELHTSAWEPLGFAVPQRPGDVLLGMLVALEAPSRVVPLEVALTVSSARAAASTHLLPVEWNQRGDSGVVVFPAGACLVLPMDTRLSVEAPLRLAVSQRHGTLHADAASMAALEILSRKTPWVARSLFLETAA